MRFSIILKQPSSVARNPIPIFQQGDSALLQDGVQEIDVSHYYQSPAERYPVLASQNSNFYLAFTKIVRRPNWIREELASNLGRDTDYAV